MIKVKRLLCLLLVAFILTKTGVAYGSEPKDKELLIIYTPTNQNNLEQVRILESLLGHFSNKITIKKDSELGSIHKEKYTHLFYLGLETKKVSVDLKEYVEKFNGPVFMMGKNIEQFPSRFSFVKTKGESLIHTVSIESKGLELPLPEERLTVNSETFARVLLSGKNKEGNRIPILINKDQSYYLAAESLFDPIGECLGEVLFSFFKQKANGSHQLYLRLEDVHPKTDPDGLMEIAQFLKKRRIPYMVAVIPVYINPKTHSELHFSDSPKLVKVLRYMQDNGASIVLHGYRHQYRNRETGEGFEFWDVENDRPIYQGKNDDVKDLEMDKAEKFEQEYIDSAIQKGIQELVTHKLYPLAFEAPHYAMSETGYKILSTYFSTYVGQTQLTDQTWKSDYTPKFESQPYFLHGMRLLPETVGYVEEGNPDSLSEIKQKARTLEKFSDAYISGFYHPYLGLAKLKKLVSTMESVPNSEWLDLKKQENTVAASGINLSSAKGKIIVEKDFISSEYERNYIVKKLGIWTAGIGIPLIIIVYIFVRRRRK